MQPQSWTLDKRKKYREQHGGGLNPEPTDYNPNAPWPLGHTAVKFEHIYRENLKIGRFIPVSELQSFKRFSSGGVRNRLNTFTPFSIFHKTTGFIKMERSYVSLIQNLILLTRQSRSVAIELISAIGHVNFAMPRILWWYTPRFDHSKIRRHFG